MSYLGPHLLGIRGLKREQVDFVLDTADQFVQVNLRNVKKVPALRGKTVVNLFLEASTRTRSSFEIAGKRLSADVVNVSGSSSSMTKGETLIDTALTLQAMAPDIVVIRHEAEGAPHLIAGRLSKCAVVNAGDGWHEHPSQALLDALTIRQRLGRIDKLTMVMVGDVLRSRVARSDILLHQLYGNELRIVAPPAIAVPQFEKLGVKVFYDMEPALEGADVVMSLRMKHEYGKGNFVPSMVEYSRKYLITEALLSKYCPKCIVLAPGPFIRGTEVTSEVVDGPRGCINVQVANGVAVRMAILFLLTVGTGERSQVEKETELEESAA